MVKYHDIKKHKDYDFVLTRNTLQNKWSSPSSPFLQWNKCCKKKCKERKKHMSDRSLGLKILYLV